MGGRKRAAGATLEDECVASEVEGSIVGGRWPERWAGPDHRVP